ncbi:MAG: toast rack family protein [Chloroflexi bacterium]|nr:toast rack family protein [Chloroflexota bacterium]
MSNGDRKVEWSFDFENMRVRAGQVVAETLGGAEVKRLSLREALKGAESARVEIDFSVGRATLRALDVDSPNLLEADLTYVGDIEFQVEGEAQRVITLRQLGSSASGLAALISDEHDLHWDIRLARQIPLTLALKGGVGKSDIDLSRLLARRLKLETGVGQAKLITPMEATTFAAELIGGVGQSEVTIPAGGAAQLTIQGGIGAFRVLTSPGAGLRLASKTGLGRFSLPDDMQRATSGARAVWQTPNFSDAAAPIEIDFKGGLGSCSLEYSDSH